MSENEKFPIPLNEAQLKAVKEWAVDDRLWTTQETVEINLGTFARTILNTRPQPRQGDAQDVIAEVLALDGKLSGMKDEWYIKTIRALLRAATANSAPPDKTQALAYFNALWNSIEKYVGVDPECAHWPDVIRAAICSANSAENAVKGVGVEELAKMLDKKFGASFPGIEYTMGYVGKFLAKEFPNGLKITKE